MYSTFEQLIVEEGTPRRLPTPPGSQASTMSRDVKLSAMMAHADDSPTSDIIAKALKPTPTPRKSPQSVPKPKTTSPPGGSSSTSGYTSDSCSGSCSSINATNPLLDTISSLTTADPYYSDSDENASDLNVNSQGMLRCVRRL